MSPRLFDFIDKTLITIRVMPAMPLPTWLALWIVCMVLLAGNLIAKFGFDAYNEEIGLLSGLGFFLLALTPLQRIVFHALVSTPLGDRWLEVPRALLAQCITDPNVKKLERVEMRDGRIKSVESLRLPPSGRP